MRLRARVAGVLVAATLLAAGAALAALSVTSLSTLEVGVRGAPVQLQPGPGAETSRHVHNFRVSPHGTSFSGTLQAKSGTDTVVTDLLRVHNPGAQARQVTLTAEHVTNPRYETYTWTIRANGTAVGVVDHRSPTPGATFTLPAGATYRLDLRIALREGSGNADASGAPFGLGMEVR